MRVLMISDVYFPRVNGVSTSIQVFRDELAGLGVATTLVAPRYPAQLRDRDPAVRRIPSWRVPRDPEDRLMSAAVIARLALELKSERHDLVHIQTPFVAHYAGLSLARRFGVPVVASYHTYFEHYLHHYVPLVPAVLTRLLARRLTRAQCRAVDAVIAPSAQLAGALRGYGIDTRIEVIPTGMPAASFRAGNGARFRGCHGIAPGRPVVTFVGRVAHEKNVDFLIDMLPYLRAVTPDVLLVIAGEGPARRHCERRVAAAGLAASTLFVGYLDREAGLADCYRAADLFVFASRTETQGLVLLEAMAQGTPVLSTAVMGTIDVLAGTRGAVVAPEDPRAFATLAAGLLADPQRRAALGRAARASAEAWSARAQARKLLACYESLLAASRVTGTLRGGRPATGDVQGAGR